MRAHHELGVLEILVAILSGTAITNGAITLTRIVRKPKGGGR